MYSIDTSTVSRTDEAATRIQGDELGKDNLSNERVHGCQPVAMLNREAENELNTYFSHFGTSLGAWVP